MNHKPMWDQGAEQAVIGAILADERVLADVKAVVSPADFFYDVHQQLYRAALGMAERGEPVDVMTMLSACPSHSSYIGDLALNMAIAANAKGYAERVADWSRRRSIVEACKRTIDEAAGKRSGELIAELSGRIEQAGERAIGESLDWNGVLTRMIATIEQATKAGDDGVVGVRTHIPMIDNAIGGLCPERLIMLAARPSIGKTALANQIAVNAARDGVPGGICSLEMGEDELGARAMAYHCRTNFTRLLRGRDDALDAMMSGMRQGAPKSWPLHLDTSTYSLSGIEARITSWKRTHDIQYAIVDHIGLVEIEDNRLNENDRIGVVTRRLKKLAKRLKIAIVAVSQLNRSNEKEKRKPSLSDFRGSGNIEQDIDIGMFLHVDPEDADQPQVPVWIGFLKNRTGRKGWQKDALLFEGRYQTFTEKTQAYDEYEEFV